MKLNRPSSAYIQTYVQFSLIMAQAKLGHNQRLVMDMLMQFMYFDDRGQAYASRPQEELCAGIIKPDGLSSVIVQLRNKGVIEVSKKASKGHCTVYKLFPGVLIADNASTATTKLRDENSNIGVRESTPDSVENSIATVDWGAPEHPMGYEKAPTGVRGNTLLRTGKNDGKNPSFTNRNSCLDTRGGEGLSDTQIRELTDEEYQRILEFGDYESLSTEWDQKTRATANSAYQFALSRGYGAKDLARAARLDQTWSNDVGKPKLTYPLPFLRDLNRVNEALCGLHAPDGPSI